jgi:hypothetical protein
MSTEADKEYLKRHGIPGLFNDITQDLFKERPENPVRHIIEHLKKKKAEREREAQGGSGSQGQGQGGSNGGAAADP